MAATSTMLSAECIDFSRRPFGRRRWRSLGRPRHHRRQSFGREALGRWKRHSRTEFCARSPKKSAGTSSSHPLIRDAQLPKDRESNRAGAHADAHLVRRSRPRRPLRRGRCAPRADHSAFFQFDAKSRARASTLIAIRYCYGCCRSSPSRNTAYDKAAELYASALETAALVTTDEAARRKLLLRLGSSLGRDGKLQEASRAFRSAGLLQRPWSSASRHRPRGSKLLCSKRAFTRLWSAARR